MLKIGAIKKRWGYEGYLKCVIRGEEIWRVRAGVQMLERADAIALAQRLKEEQERQSKAWPAGAAGA